MKIQALLLLGCNGMQHEKGRPDGFAIHIGGGAFDAGTSEALAKWAIRKCEKKVCAVWPWAQCPLGSRQFDRERKLTQAPCCHKCWNKCPPYLARHKMHNQSVFSDNEIRRKIKEEIWRFLEDDIECEKTKMKDIFFDNTDDHGMDFSVLKDDIEQGHGIMHDDCEEGDEECENNFESLLSSEGGELTYNFNPNMMNDLMMNDPPMSAPSHVDTKRREAQCTGQWDWYKCHGTKEAKCCKGACLNQEDGEAKKHCDLCQCNGRCDYLHSPEEAQAKKRELRCHEFQEKNEEY